MEIREQHNLARLLIESFALLNRCGSALAGYIIVLLLFLAAEIALVWGAGIPLFILKLLNYVVSAYFAIVLLRIFGAKAEQTDESVSSDIVSQGKPFRNGSGA